MNTSPLVLAAGIPTEPDLAGKPATLPEGCRPLGEENSLTVLFGPLLECLQIQFRGYVFP